MNQGHSCASQRSGWKYFRFPLLTIIVVTIIFLQSRSLLGLNQAQNTNKTSWSNTAVTFPNNQSAAILNLTETQIDTAVPDSSTSGNVSVTTDTGASNSVSFEMGSSAVPDESGEATTWQSTFSGVINADTVWNSDLLLTGDVTVPAGITLTIEGGTTIFAAANSDDQSGGKWIDKTELIVFGTLLVSGSNSTPVYFTSNATTKSPGNWGGIQIHEGSTTSLLTNCMIRYANEGVRIISQDVPGGGDAWARIQNCSIQYNTVGIGMWANTNWPSGIHIHVGAEITNNLIANNVEEGIFLRNWCGYQSATTDPIIRNNTIEQNGTGIYLRVSSWWLGHVDDRTTIINNRISNNETYGISLEAQGSSDTSGSDTDSKPTITNNLLFGNYANIYMWFDPYGSDGLQDFQPIIQFNTISDAPVGILVAETQTYDTYNPAINHNVFMGFAAPASYAIANQSSRIIYANDTYWGSNPAEWDVGMPIESVAGLVYSSSTFDSNSLPLITMISPGRGEAGENVTIHGANFGSFPEIYLPVLLRQVVTNMQPIFIGSEIPVRDVQTPHETFYSTTIQIPAELPSTGNFYFSAQPNSVSPVLVDDEIIVKANGTIIYTHDFSAGGMPQTAILIIPRPLIEQMMGQTVTVEYRDVYGNVITASEMWLIWVP